MTVSLVGTTEAEVTTVEVLIVVAKEKKKEVLFRFISTVNNKSHILQTALMWVNFLFKVIVRLVRRGYT